MNDNAIHRPNNIRDKTFFFSEKYIDKANKKKIPPNVSDEKRHEIYGINHINKERAR